MDNRTNETAVFTNDLDIANILGRSTLAGALEGLIGTFASPTYYRKLIPHINETQQRYEILFDCEPNKQSTYFVSTEVGRRIMGTGTSIVTNLMVFSHLAEDMPDGKSISGVVAVYTLTNVLSLGYEAIKGGIELGRHFIDTTKQRHQKHLRIV